MFRREESPKGLLYGHDLLDACLKISTSYDMTRYAVPSAYISYGSTILSSVG